MCVYYVDPTDVGLDPPKHHKVSNRTSNTSLIINAPKIIYNYVVYY